MRIIYLFILSICLTTLCYSQDFKIRQGEEIKMHGSSNSLQIITRDNTGVYLMQGRAKGNMMSRKDPYSTDYSFYKFDNNYSLLFSKEYDEYLKGYDLNSLQVLNGGIYMFATNYNKKENIFTVYGSRINKSTGEPDPGFITISSFPADEKDDVRSLKITTAGDGTFIMITQVITETVRTVTINVLDGELKKKKSAVIKYDRTASITYVPDEVVSVNDKIFVLERKVEDVVVKKKITDFKQLGYSLVTYDMSGKKEKAVLLEAEGKFISREKLVYLPGWGVVLAGFYTTERDKREMAGFFMYRFNAGTGALEKSTYKEITPAMFTNLTKGIPAEFPNKFLIRAFYFNPPDSSFVVTAELSYSSSGSYSDRSVDMRYVSQHLLVIHAGKYGDVKWVNLVPKVQTEIFSGATISSAYVNTMASGGGMPYYSSHTGLIKGNKLLIILNDDNANTANPKLGDNLNDVSNFKKTNLYGISIDLATGKMDRKIIASNNNDDILAPRHSYIDGNEILMPTWRDHRAGKSELRFVQITVE